MNKQNILRREEMEIPTTSGDNDILKLIMKTRNAGNEKMKKTECKSIGL